MIIVGPRVPIQLSSYSGAYSIVYSSLISTDVIGHNHVCVLIAAFRVIKLRLHCPLIVQVYGISLIFHTEEIEKLPVIPQNVL